MKSRFKYAFFCLLTVSLLLCGCQRKETDVGEYKSSSAESSEAESDLSDAAVPSSSPFSEEALALCGNYFKGGDDSWHLTITPAEPEFPEQLYVYVEDSVSEFQYFSMKFDDSTNAWPLLIEGNGNFPEAQYSLEQNGKGSVVLVCNDKEQSAFDVYYSCDMLTMPEAFTRPLNETDLLTLSKEQMGIIRNEFYAVHGRIFTNETYREYFQNRSWYVPLIEPEDFSDSALSHLHKRNVSFLMEAEAGFDESLYESNRSAYQNLPAVPYLSLLQEGEISIFTDSTHAEDMGLYYKAYGEIALPVTITPEELKSIRGGTPLQLCINEITGQSVLIRKATKEDAEYYDIGSCLLVHEDGYAHMVNFSYQPETGLYKLWIESDDTVFCTVYSGDIYVLKGAASEYFYNFEHYEEPLTERPGVYQIMDFDEEPSGFDTDYYYGNYPVFDEKGYIKALYFYGD